MMPLLYFNILMGGYGEQIAFGNIVAVLFTPRKGCVSFLKDLFSSWYKRQRDLTLVTF